tara:strand:- start:372 stop:911 length:540 start_codon:yes stop_codon:yes gene_type:complete
MPLEDLEKLLLQYSEGMPSGPPPGMGPPPDAMAETLPAEPLVEPLASPMADQMAVDPFMETGAPLDMVSPDLITVATTALVEAGFLDVASSEMTPELVQVLQQVADQIAPGVYNMNNDADLMEFVNGIANGTIPVPSAQSLTAGGAEPGGSPAGELAAGSLPGELAGGVPGALPGGPGY